MVSACLLYTSGGQPDRCRGGESAGDRKADQGGPQGQAPRRAVHPVWDGERGVSEARRGVCGARDGIETMSAEGAIMSVKELITSQPPVAIAALLLDKFHAKPDDRERAMKRLVKFIEGLNQIKPVDSGHLILGIFHVDEDGDFLDPCLYRKEELEAGCRADSELASLEDIEELACLLYTSRCV